MGPPGTFKQFIATSFCSAIPDTRSIYISFKADQSDVERYTTLTGATVEQWPDVKAKGRIRFLEARNPLSTPEEILSEVRQGIRETDCRAVVWGLRRLADMPNYGGTAVQFLEALVTLFKAHDITSLLVDWPDIGTPNMLPIVDLSQYILLTRPCRARNELPEQSQDIWKEKRNVALLRVQRDSNGFHRDQGLTLYSYSAIPPALDPAQPPLGPGFDLADPDRFEEMWRVLGVRWEKDPGLSSETELSDSKVPRQ